MEKIQRILKTIRTLRGLSQEQVAMQLNLDVSTYTKYETGKINLSLDRLEQIATIFKMDVTSLLNYDYERGVSLLQEEKEVYQAKDNLLKEKEKEVKLLNKIIALLEEKELHNIQRLFQDHFTNETEIDAVFFQDMVNQIRKNDYTVPASKKEKFNKCMDVILKLLEK